MGEALITPEALTRLVLSLLCEMDTASDAFRRMLVVKSRIVCRREALLSIRNDLRDARSSLLWDTRRILSCRDEAMTLSKLAVVADLVIETLDAVDTATTDRWWGIPSGPRTTVLFVLPFFVTFVLTGLGTELNLKVWCMLCVLAGTALGLDGGMMSDVARDTCMW